MDLNRVTWQERDNVYFGQFVLTSDMINLSKYKTGAEVSDTEKDSDNAEKVQDIPASAVQSGITAEHNEEVQSAEISAEDSNEESVSSALQEQKASENFDGKNGEEQQAAEETADTAAVKESYDNSDLSKEESVSERTAETVDESTDENDKLSDMSEDEESKSPLPEEKEDLSISADTAEEVAAETGVKEESQDQQEQISYEDAAGNADRTDTDSKTDLINEESAVTDKLSTGDNGEAERENSEQQEQCDVSAFTASLNSQYEELNKANKIAEQKLAETERETQELNRQAAELNYQNSMYKAEQRRLTEEAAERQAQDKVAQSALVDPAGENTINDGLPADSMYIPSADNSIYEEPAETDFVEDPVFSGDPAAELMTAASSEPYVPYAEDETYINTGMSDDFGENMSNQRLYRQRDTDRFQSPTQVGIGSEVNAYTNVSADGVPEYVQQGAAYDNSYANGHVNMQDQSYRSRGTVPVNQPYAGEGNASYYSEQPARARGSYESPSYDRQRASAGEPYAAPNAAVPPFGRPDAAPLNPYAAGQMPAAAPDYDRQSTRTQDLYAAQGTDSMSYAGYGSAQNQSRNRPYSYKNSNFINNRSSGAFREASQGNYQNHNTGRKPYVNPNFPSQKMQEPNSYQTQPGRADPYIYGTVEPAVSRSLPQTESQYFAPNNRPIVLVFGYTEQIKQRVSYFEPMIKYLQSRGVRVSFNYNDLNILPEGSVILCYRSGPEKLPDRMLHVLTMYENNKAAIWSELKMILSADGIRL